MEAAELAGFEWVDATGSRCFFEDGNLDLLQSIASRVASRHSGHSASVSRVQDPGLGLFVNQDLVD